jgi:hypothetical protein
MMARTVLLGAIVVVFGAIASIAAPDPRPDIAGIYQCDGTNPDGTAYQGVVEIAKVHNAFRVRWTLRDETTVVGVGISSGDMLAVSYFGGAPAVVVYKIDGSRLVGEWTMGGAEGIIASETLTKVAARPDRRRPAGPADKLPKPGPDDVRIKV